MEYKKGDKVIYSQGTEIGLVGTVMGNKGTSIAVAIPNFDSHDCDGMCPDNNGIYSSDFELEPYTFEGAMASLKSIRHFHEILEQQLSEREREIRGLNNKVEKLRKMNGV